jgi:hypothetical protein
MVGDGSFAVQDFHGKGKGLSPDESDAAATPRRLTKKSTSFYRREARVGGGPFHQLEGTRWLFHLRDNHLTL